VRIAGVSGKVASWGPEKATGKAIHQRRNKRWQPQVALHASSPGVSTSPCFKAPTDSSQLSPSTSQPRLPKSSAAQQVPEAKRGVFRPSWKGIAADAACSDANACRQGCPHGRSAEARDSRSPRTDPPAWPRSASRTATAPEPTLLHLYLFHTLSHESHRSSSQNSAHRWRACGTDLSHGTGAAHPPVLIY